MRMRSAPNSGRCRAFSTRLSVSSVRVGLWTSPASNSRPAAVIASADPRRFETSFSGSCSRKTSMPLSAAHATNRLARSTPTGREPTRKRPRRAIARGVVVRALSARIRSHGLSTPRRTAESKQPPPETSRYANPAVSRISANRSCSMVESLPARGSCPSRRMVVSTSLGIARERIFTHRARRRRYALEM